MSIVCHVQSFVKELEVFEKNILQDKQQDPPVEHDLYVSLDDICKVRYSCTTPFRLASPVRLFNRPSLSEHEL